MDTEINAERMPCEDEGRGHGDACINQGMPKIASKPQKIVERHETHSPSQLSKGINLYSSQAKEKQRSKN